MSYRFVDSFRAGAYAPARKLMMDRRTVRNMYRVSYQNKFVKLVRLVGFIVKKFGVLVGYY